jgi:hypothetical protein
MEKEKKPVDYTGLKILAVVAPVFFLFAYLGKAELGLAACVPLGMSIFAIKLRWELRKYVWFWAIIAFVLALHAWLLFVVLMPHGLLAGIGSLHAIGLLPVAVADLLIILGTIRLAEKVFSSV